MSVIHGGMRLTHISISYELKQTSPATFLYHLQLNTRYRGMVHLLGMLGLSSELRSLCLSHPLLLTQEKYKFAEANISTPEKQETVALVASCKLTTRQERESKRRYCIHDV